VRSRRPTEKILVQNRTVKGVILASGRELVSSLVIAAIHPKILIQMLPPDSVKPSYRNRVLSLKETPGVFCVHIALPADDNPPRPYNLFSSQSADIGEGAFFQLKNSTKPGWNVLSIIEKSPFEKWQKWKDTRSGQRGKEYEDTKAREVSILMERAKELLGPLSAPELLIPSLP
jgi:all-trans-retinol 13,14-reductase